MTTETTSTASPAAPSPGTPIDKPVSGAPAVPAGAPPTGVTRADRFRDELSGLRISDPRIRRETLLLRFGVLLLFVGVGLGIIGYITSHTTTNALQQRDAVDICLIGVSVTIAGAAFFLRYSLAGFLRFWLARLLFEQHERARGYDG